MTDNPDPFEQPLRNWAADEAASRVNLRVVVDALDLGALLRRVEGEQPLDDADVAALGRANFHAFLMGYAPIAALMPRSVQIAPAVAKMVEEMR